MANPSLRPLSIGEILDAGIKVCTRHWKPLALCVVIPVLPLAILQVLLIASIDPEQLEFSPESTGFNANDVEATAWVGLGVTGLVSIISFLVVTTACFKAVADAWLGAEPEVGRSLRFGLSRSPKVFLLGLIWLPAIVLALIPCGIPAVWLGTMWCLSLSVILFERGGPFKALGRSFGLLKDRFWATLLLLIVTSLLVGILGGLVSSIPTLFAELIASENRVAAGVANVVGTTVGNIITYPYQAAVLMILYFDQRVRKEGFDVQMLAEGLGESFDPDRPIPAPLAPGAYTPPPQGWQPQGSDYSGWSAPSHQNAPLRWGPAAPPPTPDDRPAEPSPWMRPAPPESGAPPSWAPAGEPSAGESPPAETSRWAPGEGAGSPPADTGTPPSGPSADAGPPLSRWAPPTPPTPPTPPASGPMTSGSPLGDDAPPRDEAPTSPLPPEPPAEDASDDEKASWESRWGGSSPFGESPWEGKPEDKKKDSDRADWQPPEEPRGPGGL